MSDKSKLSSKYWMDYYYDSNQMYFPNLWIKVLVLLCTKYLRSTLIWYNLWNDIIMQSKCNIIAGTGTLNIKTKIWKKNSICISF